MRPAISPGERLALTSRDILQLDIGPHGDGLLVAGLFFTNYPPSREKIPPVEGPGLCDPPG